MCRVPCASHLGRKYSRSEQTTDSINRDQATEGLNKDQTTEGTNKDQATEVQGGEGGADDSRDSISIGCGLEEVGHRIQRRA